VVVGMPIAHTCCFPAQDSRQGGEAPVVVGMPIAHTCCFPAQDSRQGGEAPVVVGMPIAHTCCFPAQDSRQGGEAPVVVGMPIAHTCCFPAQGLCLFWHPAWCHSCFHPSVLPVVPRCTIGSWIVVLLDASAASCRTETQVPAICTCGADHSAH
jgi:hypothetical protein